MEKLMIILGINSVYHESSAAIVVDGNLVAAAEEERFNRKKHGKPATPNNAHELPWQSIDFCLKSANTSLSAIDHIGYSFSPQLRFSKFWPSERFTENSWGSRIAEETLKKSLLMVESSLVEKGFRGHMHWLGHELCHAASAYYASHFNEAAVISIDGIGEHSTASVFSGEKTNLNLLYSIDYPNSIGFLWEKFCKLLGFSEYHACKVMGLAAYGNPERFKQEFAQFVLKTDDGKFELNNDILEFRIEDYSKLEHIFGITRRQRSEPISEIHKDIAASLQEVTNTLVRNIAIHAQKLTKSKNLCLSGGVALNCVCNSALIDARIFDCTYIQPAAHDAGTSIGAALYLSNKRSAVGRTKGLLHAYHGPEFGDEDYTKALNASNLTYTKFDNVEEIVASIIANGAIVGWFQGKMEFGPRALGNRSLLGDPRNPDLRDILNTKVKHRECFRPFAPSVLAEHASEWFEIGSYQPANDFMLLVNNAKKDKLNQIPAVLHVDGTARIQLVRKSTNERYHKLISCFFKQTGVPLLLNTSFNDDEPIVCTPNDAIDTFKKTAIDYLVLGNFVVDRKKQQGLRMTSQLV